MKITLLPLLLVAIALAACNGSGKNSSPVPAASRQDNHAFTSSIAEATMTPSPIPASATNTVWVATNGSDTSGTGRYSSPWATISHAVTSANGGHPAGWTVAVKNGTYQRIGSNSYVALIGSPGGTSGSPVKIQAQNNLGAVIDGSNNTTSIGFDFDTSVSYITIQGFVIQHFSTAGIDANGGSAGVSYANIGVYLFWNRITNNAGDGVFVGAGSHDVSIEYNEVDHTGAGNASCPGGNQWHGLYLRANGAQVSSNVFHDNNCGWDIQYSGVAGDTNPSYGSYNNTFGYHDMPSGDPGNVVLYAPTGGVTPSLLSENDIYVDNTSGTKPVDCYPATPSGSPTITINYDIWTNTAGSSMTNCTAGVTEGPNNHFVSADFAGGNPPSAGTNAAGYQLLSASPAFGNGKNLTGVVLKDFYGDSPTSPWTIGAFQNYTP